MPLERIQNTITVFSSIIDENNACKIIFDTKTPQFLYNGANLNTAINSSYNTNFYHTITVPQNEKIGSGSIVSFTVSDSKNSCGNKIYEVVSNSVENGNSKLQLSSYNEDYGILGYYSYEFNRIITLCSDIKKQVTTSTNIPTIENKEY